MTLEIWNLSAGYGQRAVVSGVAAAARGGAVTALIGPNGSGKSTLLKALAGLVPSGGEARLDGVALSMPERRRRIAYMPQETGAASTLSLLEVVLLGRLGSLGMRTPPALTDAASTMLARFGLAAMGRKRLDQVSGGQRQLAFLAQALFRRPRALLLDEPTAALDLRRQLEVLAAVRAYTAETGGVAIVAMHDLNLAARFADHVLCLADGRVEAEGPSAAVLSKDRIRRVWGVEASIQETPDGRVQITPLRPADAPAA